MAVSVLNGAPCLVGGGKGHTLRRLAPRLISAAVPDTIELVFAEWCAKRTALLAELAARFNGADVAVRSDHGEEDRPGRSTLGRFLSLLAVASADTAMLTNAIDSVFASYGKSRAHDRLLIQRFISPIRSAAVGSTHALTDGAPYYCVSMAVGPSSSAVTRGDSDVATWYVARDSAVEAALPEDVSSYLQTLREIESLGDGEPCEAEFVIDEQRRVWLLQARPITIQPVRLTKVSTFRREVEAALVVEHGHAPLLGLMSDWNPAELLGEHPRPLALDLFERVIARRAWRLARARLGYASLPGRHLLYRCAGRPYVDIDASFRSLLPNALVETDASRLVTAWRLRLREHPELHDKVEFEVAISALGCDFDSALDGHYPGTLTRDERERFRVALREPTRRALDQALSQSLHAYFELLLKLPPPSSTAEQLSLWCRRNHEPVGIAFAMAARQAFVVEAILRSLVIDGALDEIEFGRLKASVPTIASEFRAAYVSYVREDEQSRSRLLERFGHLRAGTFEIAAPRLADMADSLGSLEPLGASLAPVMPAHSVLQRINHGLAPLDLGIDAARLFDQYVRAVRLREFGKFALSRVVSLTLDALASLTDSLGVQRQDAGWLRAADLLARRADVGLLRGNIAAARDSHSTESWLRMPQLLVQSSLTAVAFEPGYPNYLGTGCVDARVATISAATRPDQVPVGSIIATASADPGFEWIFLRRPVCLVTAYGGPNSHMAIRCAEIGMPALLGLGPEAFRRVVDSARLVIDFDTRTWSCS